MALIAGLVSQLENSAPSVVFAAACAGFVRLLDIRRCSSWSEDRDRTMISRRSEVDPLLTEPERARLPSRTALDTWMDTSWVEHGPVTRSWRGCLAAEEPGRDCNVSLLVVPMGERSTFLLEGDSAWCCSAGDLEVVQIVAALVRQTSREARSAREERQHAATTDALHRLLQLGVRARSPIEAAKALASTAAQVLDFPVACAYLVDDGGTITDVVSTGINQQDAARLRLHLVGQAARGSPVWRRAVEGPSAGPDLIGDTGRSGSVRHGGVAQSLGLRSMAAIPLLSSQGPLGLVLCGDHAPRPRWRFGDRELLAQLSLEGAVVVDNARLRAAERFEATHDALTGLLNRRAFSELLREAVVAASRSGEPVATLLLDLDRFKEVNDQLGHHRGDDLLIAVGQRLRRCLRATDVLARLGGDEFAVLTRRGALGNAEEMAERISASLSEPFEMEGFLLQMDASIGIACSPDHASDVDGLLQRADAAMYKAKRSGQDYAVAGRSMTARAGPELGLLGELRRALDRGEQLALHYQPKIDLRTGSVTGVEALVRWQHPRHGLLSPDRFVPMAEETGLIRALTNWVVPEALRQVHRWEAEDLDLRVSVNVSARDIADAGFVSRVEHWLATAGVPGDRLVVEVTEGSVMRDRPESSAALEHLRRLGVATSLDDFGTGYSSLAYLETLPIDEVKIDRQFLLLARSRWSVVRSIVLLGHELGMSVVAEGVERPDQVTWLADAGCDEVQGYYFSRPLPAGDLSRWVRQHVGVTAESPAC
ncbi:MAG: putative bifunctional diguanylate cyclase/phosphodiesterase [Acidimicrobiales bacterium]